jgi:hypothetical protein
VGDDYQEITIFEETDYPFSEKIDFWIQTEKPVEFTLWLRIPGWCENPSLSLNGKPIEEKLIPGSFFPVKRVFTPDDSVMFNLPMPLKIQHWPKGGISIERGPLVFSLRIEENWRIDKKDRKSTTKFPAWNLYAKSRWNYALDLDLEHPEADIEIVHKPIAIDPWNLDSAPIELHVTARRVKGWKIEKKRKVINQIWQNGIETEMETKGRFAFTPQLPDPINFRKKLSKKVVKVSLVPYGCTHLRITIFPNAKAGG